MIGFSSYDDFYNSRTNIEMQYTKSSDNIDNMYRTIEIGQDILRGR